MSFLDGLESGLEGLSADSGNTSSGNTSSDWANYYNDYSKNPTNTLTSSTSGGNSGGFLGGIFTQQKGGTFIGNLIRSAAGNASNGVWGQGKNMLNNNGTYGNGDKSSTISDVIAGFGAIAAGTPQGRQVIADSSAKYISATGRNNMVTVVL